MIEQLIKKFEANSIKHLILIFTIFALSGSGSLLVSSPITNIIQFSTNRK